MQTVQPIREREQIAAMKQYLRNKSERDYLLFCLGINVGLRISDLLTLKVADVKDRDFHVLKEKKTGKTRRVYFNKDLKAAIEAYTQEREPDNYLFPSRKGSGPISRVQAYRILNEAATSCGLEEIGTHTLRKTFGYWHYKTNKDIAILQDELNHASPSITMRYIGINEEMKQKAREAFSL